MSRGGAGSPEENASKNLRRRDVPGSQLRQPTRGNRRRASFVNQATPERIEAGGHEGGGVPIASRRSRGSRQSDRAAAEAMGLPIALHYRPATPSDDESSAADTDWVHTIKFDAEGTFSKLNVRWCLQGTDMDHEMYHQYADVMRPTSSGPMNLSHRSRQVQKITAYMRSQMQAARATKV